MTITEIVSTQEQIIRLQSEVIDGLFATLSQHISAQELDGLPEIDKINLAAGLRRDIKMEVDTDG